MNEKNENQKILNYVEAGQPAPKFKDGDKVNMRKKTLYNETEGVIEGTPERMYQKLGPVGTFQENEVDPHGLVTSEHTIKGIQLTYRFDGVTLEVDYPEHDYGSWIQKAYTSRSKFIGWAYSVRTPKMLTAYSEKSLKSAK